MTTSSSGPLSPPLPRGRLRDHGLAVGMLPPGPLNTITDVPGVRVGHATAWSGDPGGTAPVVRTGVTAVLPHEDSLFHERVYAATSTFNGYGIMTADLVIDEWGLLGAPILICDTAHVGAVCDAAVRHLTALDPVVGADDVFMPVVAECDDGFLNDNRAFGLTSDDVVTALTTAAGGHVAEGVVGAGTGTQLFDFKGGIGTASRVVPIDGDPYTVGVLLSTNYGTRSQLRVLGDHVGPRLVDRMPVRHREGSCIGVVATDLPLHPHQLRRLARRVDAGLVRTGSVGNDGSGEIFLAFSTAHRIPRIVAGDRMSIEVLVEGQYWTHGSPFDVIFDAVAEATEEAALNALVQADTVVGRDGNVLYGFPLEALAER